MRKQTQHALSGFDTATFIFIERGFQRAGGLKNPLAQELKPLEGLSGAFNYYR